MIYQIYFDDVSKSKLDSGFIPIRNGATHNYENDVILNVWRGREWVNSDYVGVLSWRFFQKTGLTSEEIQPKGEINIYECAGYAKYDSHPFTRDDYKSIIEMCKIADYYKLFPFQLRCYKVNRNVWCNYWIVKPHIFDEYCTNYLSKAVEFFKDKEIYNAKEMHRGEMVYSFTFFLEGLFSVYLTEYENRKHNVQGVAAKVKR